MKYVVFHTIPENRLSISEKSWNKDIINNIFAIDETKNYDDSVLVPLSLWSVSLIEGCCTISNSKQYLERLVSLAKNKPTIKNGDKIIYVGRNTKYLNQFKDEWELDYAVVNDDNLPKDGYEHIYIESGSYRNSYPSKDLRLYTGSEIVDKESKDHSVDSVKASLKERIYKHRTTMSPRLLSDIDEDWLHFEKCGKPIVKESNELKTPEKEIKSRIKLVYL